MLHTPDTSDIIASLPTLEPILVRFFSTCVYGSHDLQCLASAFLARTYTVLDADEGYVGQALKGCFIPLSSSLCVFMFTRPYSYSYPYPIPYIPLYPFTSVMYTKLAAGRV